MRVLKRETTYPHNGCGATGQYLTAQYLISTKKGAGVCWKGQTTPRGTLRPAASGLKTGAVLGRTALVSSIGFIEVNANIHSVHLAPARVFLRTFPLPLARGRACDGRLAAPAARVQWRCDRLIERAWRRPRPRSPAGVPQLQTVKNYALIFFLPPCFPPKAYGPTTVLTTHYRQRCVPAQRHAFVTGERRCRGKTSPPVSARKAG